VGLGTIGKKVARRAPAFDMRVQYYDIVRLSEDQEDALGVRKARGLHDTSASHLFFHTGSDMSSSPPPLFRKKSTR